MPLPAGHKYPQGINTRMGAGAGSAGIQKGNTGFRIIPSGHKSAE